MSHIGSVFLGDVQRHRHLSTSTPPSSPPPNVGSSATFSFSDVDLDDADQQKPPATQVAPPSISPALSLELRLRWLETLLFGAKHDVPEQSGKGGVKAEKLKDGESLTRRAEDLQRRLDSVAQSNDALKRFMDRYEQYAHMLTPAFALSGSLPVSPPTYESMSATELDAFLAEMESDIRAAERDLREINALESKGVTGAGKLGDYEALQPRLEALLQAHDEDSRVAADLEKRIALLMDHYATNVDTLSELFVSWDETIRDAREEVDKLEKDRDERRKLGYE
ncbi:hypothetical protein DICSQDRAFT_159938 [Dichomitus squalens LYAD-421 SS1]|uniref:uncharacterized protein n=1 Tax=Dichomitus squalens (strain LYAD-421) TaxID=732165 RepID=UPI0004415543|nr:uncharacterized protein DICSQDRAFT_159938 [Dichomitus squalens LYAD-421 SS1]EJF63995.1 hypothetical protein DICSQDRAFT_159938 [Dichomitus squalens LYAD-421 SS1]